MMRRITWVFILFLALASMPAVAQQNFGSISFGTSIPQGDFGSTEDISNSGYALTGGVIRFDGAYFPGSYLGIGGTFSFGSNYVERDSLLSDMITYIEENASSTVDIPEDAEILYGSGFWNNINLLIGPQFAIRATQRLYFDFRALAGLTVLRFPDQELRITYDGNEIYSVTSGNTLSFGFTTGIGLRYNLNSNIALKLAADYYQTKAKYTYTCNLFQDLATDVPPLDAEYYLRTVDFSIGLAYNF